MTDQDRAITRVGIAGVTGYRGREAARLLARHPLFEVVMASSDALAGKRLGELDANLGPSGDVLVVGAGDAASTARKLGCDLMISALEPYAAGELIAPVLAAGIRVVDLSGAYRLVDPEAHALAYGFERPHAELAAEAVYGLTEWADRDALCRARLVAAPGGYATAVLLALLPLVEADLIAPGTLVVDAKSGSTEAGRSARVALLHSEIFGNFHAYRVGRHQQVPEIIQEARRVGRGRPLEITFVAHLLPVARGLLATCYLRVPDRPDARAAALEAREALGQRYAESPFIDILRSAEDVTLRAVIGTNRCAIGASADPHGQRVVVVAALDNLIKGAAGQAIQSANAMVGLDERVGLAAASWGEP